jgi:hypothetical protein
MSETTTTPSTGKAPKFTAEELKIAKTMTETAKGEKSIVMRSLYVAGWPKGKIAAVLTEVHYGKAGLTPGLKPEVRFQHVQNVVSKLTQGQGKPELTVPSAA